MRIMLDRSSAATQKLGPVCIACGNTRTFWVQEVGGVRVVEIRDVPDGEVRVHSCGRCRSRNSIVVAHVD